MADAALHFNADNFDLICGSEELREGSDSLTDGAEFWLSCAAYCDNKFSGALRRHLREIVLVRGAKKYGEFWRLRKTFAAPRKCAEASALRVADAAHQILKSRVATNSVKSGIH